jgi:hypothetical protein
MRRLVTALLIATLVTTLVFAAAATLGGISGTSLGAGSASVAACDGNGFTATYTVTSGNVTAVTISGIADPGCEGGQLSVTLTNSGGTSIASAGPVAVPTDGDALDNSMTLPVSPVPPAAQVTGIHVVVEGP